MKKILEVAVDSVESAMEAEKGGADRLELGSALIVGGLTPSLSLYEEVREKTGLPVHILLRPRYGDFLYTEEELQLILKDTVRFFEAGADAVVTGCLTREGKLDVTAMERIMDCAKGKKVCLHRAFDMCGDMNQALKDAEKLGIDTILTSGGCKSAWYGIDTLAELNQKADRVNIMAGAGVNAANIPTIREKTGISMFHMSGKVTVESEMAYRNPRVNMGVEGFSEYEIIRTSAEKIRAAKKALNQE